MRAWPREGVFLTALGKAPEAGAGQAYKDIRRADVRQYMQGLVLKGDLSASSIASIGDVLRAVFSYALHEDLIEANPTA